MAEELSKTPIYAQGTLGMPLAVIGYPLPIWIPAHYLVGLGLSLAMAMAYKSSSTLVVDWLTSLFVWPGLLTTGSIPKTREGN